MPINNFIPEVWSARLLLNLHNNLVFGNVANRDYEGDIANQGDTVRINAIGPVTVGNYTKNADMAAPEALTDAQTTLVITESKMFNFAIDDVDRAQQVPKVMDGAMREAGYALANTADQFIAGLYTGVAAANTIGTNALPKTDLGTAGKPYAYLVALSVLLDQANVPDIDRWVVAPPWFIGQLLLDTRFTGFGTPEQIQTLRSGKVGQTITGMDIYKSNNCPNGGTAGTNDKIIAGWRGAISFADQISKVEAYRPEKRFADAMKGLHLYGAKLVRPTGIAVLTATAA